MQYGPLSASAAYNFSEDMQEQIAWNAILQTVSNNRPGPVFQQVDDWNQYQVNFNFIMSPNVVQKFQDLGYVVTTAAPQPPSFNNDVPGGYTYINNGSDLAGHTYISWNVGPLWPSYNLYSGTIGEPSIFHIDSVKKQ